MDVAVAPAVVDVLEELDDRLAGLDGSIQSPEQF